MKENLNNNSDEIKERWDFIEEARKEVNGWSAWKRAEVCPSKFQTQEEIKVTTSSNSNKISFD